MMAATVTFRPGLPGSVPDCLLLSPTQPAEGPAIVVVHGIHREVSRIAEHLTAVAEQHRRQVLLPLFAHQDWPRYQRAACPRRADWALLRLLEACRLEQRLDAGPVDLAGFSGGAQFAHRFAWLYPTLVGRLTVASAGWWTFPDAAPFPYGLGPVQEGPAQADLWFRSNLAAFLDRDIVIRVGSDDDQVDRNTRSGPEIDAQQGRHRRARAGAWAQAIAAAMRAHDLHDRVDFAVLAGCGHQVSDCLSLGLDGVFVPPCTVPDRWQRSVA